MSHAAVYEWPAWLRRVPDNADALYVAAAIERNLPQQAWAGAIDEARNQGFLVDTDYLRDRWTLTRGMARRSDPLTSYEASERVNASGSRADHVSTIVLAVQATPGRTSAELARITGLERHEAARRTADAEHEGRIHKGAQRVCEVSGKRAVSWWPGAYPMEQAA